MTMKTYASLAALKAELAIPAANTDHDDDLGLALVAATRWVDWRIGDLDVAADDVWTGDPADLELATGVKAGVVLATIAAAIRYAKSSDVPFGVAGMNDQGVVAYVRSSIPEAELLLAEAAQSWGIA